MVRNVICAVERLVVQGTKENPMKNEMKISEFAERIKRGLEKMVDHEISNAK